MSCSNFVYIEDENDKSTDQLTEKANIVQQILTFKSWRVFSRLKYLTDIKLLLCEREVSEVYKNHIQLTLDDSVHLALKTIQESDDWNIERKKRITGSKAYNLFTYYFNTNPNWDRKYNQVFHSEFNGNEATIHGLHCEEFGKEKYANQTNSELIETGLLIRHEVPWLGYRWHYNE
ncbi:hypothetical protein ALC60_07592 [Trachymyrmex zeteki]|uniref:YqaJ viral recombinase domain-containing protein n=1 Tax=Mycetomoellerius zeteki TaxID=64791 RepID=A0A151WZI3_9HYME|nr:hypothetical protein ALC60_07592 [Trachymyrmex zeteki]